MGKYGEKKMLEEGNEYKLFIYFKNLKYAFLFPKKHFFFFAEDLI